MKAVAFYLPQYHAIPENDRWWGTGFTEWNNVRLATPMFPGHYQPRVPHGALGYYDLSDIKTIEKQHALAMRYGVTAFCYYYYNFSGRTLLDKPLVAINKSKTIQNEFCLCWANHDWTRTWYGQDKTVLIKQIYGRESAERVILDALKYFQNERYLTVDGKPLFLVFNPEDNPLMREYAEIWRERVHTASHAGLFLVGVEAMTIGERVDRYGFDASVEFAPDWSRAVLASAPDCRPRIYDYQATVKNMLCKPMPPYTRMRCVFPGWDNTPRYKARGLVFGNTSMGAFKYALNHARLHTERYLPESLQYVFINAWNEWGEGCHLEPDERYGFQPLQMVAEVFK